tara:strand:- start:2234 stop:2464 length:231 start_codon:yes stop_codon:yes gene_type:complete
MAEKIVEINLLTDRGWTIENIANHPLLAVSRQSVHNWKTGTREITQGRRNILKFLLTIPIDQIPVRKSNGGRPITR